MKIIIAFLIATLVFITLKVIRLVLKNLIDRYSGLNYLENLLMALEFVIWVVFIFWITNFLFREFFFYPYLIYALILILISFLSWFLLRDIFAGIFFRIHHNLKNGAYIKANGFTGQIKSKKLSYLKVMTGSNQLLRVPYSKIIHETITEMAYPEASEEHIIHLRVDRSVGKVNDAESLLRSAIINCPWSNLKEEPTIIFLKDNEDGYHFDITLLSITMKQMKYLQMALEEIPPINIIS